MHDATEVFSALRERREANALAAEESRREIDRSTRLQDSWRAIYRCSPWDAATFRTMASSIKAFCSVADAAGCRERILALTPESVGADSELDRLPRFAAIRLVQLGFATPVGKLAKMIADCPEAMRWFNRNMPAEIVDDAPRAIFHAPAPQAGQPPNDGES
ncbi:MAG: hypothetical protein KDA71_15100, partial [Planctomycetales bacterium]|nr:hypothetical protein [Planctomycetales bacterium]